MTITESEPGLVRAAPTGRAEARARFPARPVPAAWPATMQSRGQVQDRLAREPFVMGNAYTEKIRGRGLTFLLDWLEDQPGATWQERWLASGADAAGTAWREGPASWLRGQGPPASWRLNALGSALLTAISADVVRPALSWLAVKATGPGSLVRHLARSRDPEGFTRLRALCGADPHVSAVSASHTVYRAAELAAAKGGQLGDITVGDFLELLDIELDALASVPGDVAVSYQMLHAMGIFGHDAPASLREIRSLGQRTPEELIDRYRLRCRPVRDLLVDYLRERQPALDYTSLKSLACTLGMLFWQDLERHNPGISSLHLSAEIAGDWKQRLRTKPKTVTSVAGEKPQAQVPRLNYQECMVPVRAFYLDLAQWAVDDPGRWGPWAVPCPIREQETGRRKARRHRKSRMDARTRERLPVLPVLVQTVNERRAAAQALLETARQARHGEAFTAAGQRLTRVVTRHGTAVGRVWAADPGDGKRRDLTFEEEQAFWTWAIVEVLRSTGVRIEELLEISHHSLVQYRLPATGELVPLLQIAPSKTDAERLHHWWSVPSWPMSCPPLSAASATAPGKCPASLPTTGTSASGCRLRRCCSSAGSAPKRAGSAPMSRGTCSQVPSRTLALLIRPTAAPCAIPPMTSGGYLSRRPS